MSFVRKFGFYLKINEVFEGLFIRGLVWIDVFLEKVFVEDELGGCGCGLGEGIGYFFLRIRCNSFLKSGGF